MTQLRLEDAEEVVTLVVFGPAGERALGPSRFPQRLPRRERDSTYGREISPELGRPR